MRVASPESAPPSLAVVPDGRRSLKSDSRDDSLKNSGSALHARFSTSIVAAGKTGSKLFKNEGWKMRTKRRTSADLAVDSLLSEVSVRPKDEAGIRRSSMDSGDNVADGGDEQTVHHLESSPPREDTNDSIFAVEGCIDPDFPLIRFLSPFALFLDRLRIFFACWSLAYTPVLWAFDDAVTGFLESSASHCLELSGDIIFIGGILLSFITSVGSSTAGREYVTPKVIRRKRLTSITMWCDVFSCLPLLSGMFVGEAFNPTGFYRGWHLLKLLRMHWVLRMPASHFEMQFNTTVQVLRMLVWIALSTHLIGCLWYAVAFGNGVVARHLEEFAHVSGVTHYLVALKQGVYMVTGKPVTPYCDDELLMIGITSPVGGIFFAFIYGNTTMLLTRINILMSKHHKQVALIRSTMRTLDIPHELRERIARYHHFLAVHHNINAYTSLMQGLSVNLFIELKAHLFRKMFSQGAFFRDAPGGFLRRLLQEMIEATFCPGDVVIRCGDLGDQMYFVVKGRLDVLSADGVNIGKISENQYFGEIALLISTPRLVSIRATTYCLLAMINRETFLPLLEAYPEQKRRMYDCMKNYKHLQEDEDDTECAGANSQDSREVVSENDTDYVSESMKGLRTSGTAWSDQKFPSDGHEHNVKVLLSHELNGEKDYHDKSNTLSVPGQKNKVALRRKSAQSTAARRLSALSKASACSARISDVMDETHTRTGSHCRVEPTKAETTTTNGDTNNHCKLDIGKNRKKSGFLAEIQKVWTTPRNSVSVHSRRQSEVEHFVGALGRVPKQGHVRSARPSLAMNIGAAGMNVGPPAVGTLLHASQSPAQLLHETGRWSLVSDLVLDRSEELERSVEVLLDDMETRLIEHIDETFEAPMREMMQEASAMREALNENTRTLQAFMQSSSVKSPSIGD